MNNNECISKNSFFLKDNFFNSKKNMQINSCNDLLNEFCNINDEDDIILDYRYFKLLKKYKTTIEDEQIIQHIINTIQKVLEKKNLFTVHVSLKSFTISDTENNYKLILNISNNLKTLYPNNLDKCYVYNAPFIFSQFYTILSLFVDKETIKKIKLIK